jgi:type I restriction enzyme S subunit
MEKLQPKLRFPEFKGDWLNVKLKDVSNYFNGGSYENNVQESGKYELITLKSVDMDGNLAHSNRFLDINVQTLRKNTLIMILSEQSPGLLGMTALIPTNNRYVLNQRVAEIRPNDMVDSYFLSMSINRNQQYFSKLGAGTKVQNISKPNVENYLFSCPSLPEQTKIATFLSSIDEKLNLLKEKKEALETYKKGMMQKIFTQELRFKDEDGNDFSEWEEKQIKNIFKVTRGTVLPMTLVNEKKDNEFNYPVYSSQTKNNGLAGFYNEYLFENAITWTTDGAGAGDVKYRYGKFYCTNVCGVLLNDEGYCNLFVAEILNSISRKYVSYVGNPKLMNNVMAEISIFIPSSIQEQNKISNFLSAIDEKISLVSTQIEEMQEYKKGLLQGMFC